MSHLPYMCQNCISYSHLKDGSTEPSSPLYGGSISPFTPACCKYISIKRVYGYKSKPKKWFRAKTMEDMDDSRSRLY